MTRLNRKKLALFLGDGETLENWDKNGFLKREIALYNLLAKKFYKIYIFTCGSKKDQTYQSLLKRNILIIPKVNNLNNKLYELIIPFKFKQLLNKCDIYKTNQNMDATAPTLCKLLYGNNLVIRSGFIASLFAKLDNSRLFFRSYVLLLEFFSYLFCDKAFHPTEVNCNILIKKYPFLKKKLVMVNNFTDTSLFVNKRLNKKYDLIYVARLEKQKNHLNLLESLKGLDLSLCLVGQGSYEEKIKTFARSNDLHVTIIKSVPNEILPNLYNSAKMFISPSLYEGNPKALMEAMSCGLPVIGYNVMGVNNLIENGKNGILCEPNAKELRPEIIKLLKDKKLQRRLGKNAREYILKNFSLDKLVKKEIKIYEDLLKNDN